MKKFTLGLLSIALVSVLFCLSVNAEECEYKNIISTTGTASKYVKPDVVNITLALLTENKELAKAIEVNNARSKNIYNALKKILKDEDQIKTTNYRVNPVYSRVKGQYHKIIAHKVTNQVTVRTKQIDIIGKLVEAAMANGANKVSNLSYSISNREEISRELLGDAAKNARKEAEIIADALGIKIIGIQNIRTTYSSPGPRPMYKSAMRQAESVNLAGSSPSFESGDMKITSKVYIDFIIE